jgi:hypothetical protein
MEKETVNRLDLEAETSKFAWSSVASLSVMTSNALNKKMQSVPFITPCISNRPYE